MANIDFNNVLADIGDNNELVISCAYPYQISDGEILHLSNFPEEKYALFIFAGGIITGPCSDDKTIAANKSLRKRLANIIFRAPANNMIYIIDKRPVRLEFPNYKQINTVSVSVEHGTRVPVSFSVSYRVQFRINPEMVSDLMWAYFTTEIPSANEHFLTQFHQLVYDRTVAYIEEYTETLSQIETYEGLLNKVEAIESNINRLSQRITSDLRDVKSNPELRFYLIEKFEIISTCNEKSGILNEVNAIAEMRSEQDKLLEEQRLQEELKQRKLAASIQSDATEHEAQLHLQSQTFAQEQEQAALAFKAKQEQADLQFAQSQKHASIAFAQEQEQARLASETQAIIDRAAIDTRRYERELQLCIDLKREDMMFSIETRKMIRDSTRLFLEKYITAFHEVLSRVYSSFDTFVEKNGGIEPEQLQPVVDALKALDVFDQPDVVVNDHLARMTEMLCLETSTDGSVESLSDDTVDQIDDDTN